MRSGLPPPHRKEREWSGSSSISTSTSSSADAASSPRGITKSASSPTLSQYASPAVELRTASQFSVSLDIEEVRGESGAKEEGLVKVVWPWEGWGGVG